jgi:hypothetical protein
MAFIFLGGERSGDGSSILVLKVVFFYSMSPKSVKFLIFFFKIGFAVKLFIFSAVKEGCCKLQYNHLKQV